MIYNTRSGIATRSYALVAKHLAETSPQNDGPKKNISAEGIVLFIVDRSKVNTSYIPSFILQSFKSKF